MRPDGLDGLDDRHALPHFAEDDMPVRVRACVRACVRMHVHVSVRLLPRTSHPTRSSWPCTERIAIRWCSAPSWPSTAPLSAHCIRHDKPRPDYSRHGPSTGTYPSAPPVLPADSAGAARRCTAGRSSSACADRLGRRLAGNQYRITTISALVTITRTVITIIRTPIKIMNTCAGVRQFEVLVLELLAVNRLAAGAVVVRKVPTCAVGMGWDLERCGTCSTIIGPCWRTE